MADPKDKDAVPEHDVVLIHGPTEDGAGVQAIRSRPGQLALTEIRPVVEGKPLTGGEVVRLQAREGSPALFDVEVLHRVEPTGPGRPPSAGPAEPPARTAVEVLEAGPPAAHEGPARVSSEAFRRGWDQAFGRRRSRSELN